APRTGGRAARRRRGSYAISCGCDPGRIHLCSMTSTNGTACASPRHRRQREASMRDILQRVHRRGFVARLFGGAAAGLAGRAMAQTPDPVPCLLRPAPPQEGPLVWQARAQSEVDAAYDQRFYAPMGFQISKREARVSEGVGARLGEPLRLAYGPTEIEKLDVHRARRPNAPIFMFFHG